MGMSARPAKAQTPLGIRTGAPTADTEGDEGGAGRQHGEGGRGFLELPTLKRPLNRNP